MGTKMHLVGEVEVRNRLVVFASSIGIAGNTGRVASTSVGFWHFSDKPRVQTRVRNALKSRHRRGQRTDRFNEVKLNRGRPMAMKSQDDWTASSFLACFPTELFGAFWRDIISKSSADIAKAVDALVEPKICRAARSIM